MADTRALLATRAVARKVDKDEESIVERLVWIGLSSAKRGLCCEWIAIQQPFRRLSSYTLSFLDRLAMVCVATNVFGHLERNGAAAA